MIEYVNFQNDVRFIADDEDGDCMDIDVKPGVEKVIFGDYYDFFLKLSKKVFPDVKELHISEYAGVISISNEMFPNVRKVTSEKNFYREGSMLCGGLHGDFSLYNTFCLKPDETADLSGISAILDFAFSGSETLNVTGSDGINTYNREAFNNSAIGRLPFVNGVKCINGMVFDVDTECDNVVFPDEDEDLHTIANHLPFEKIKQITVHRGSTVQLDWLDSRNFTTLFVPGNHENYDRLTGLEDKDVINAWMYAGMSDNDKKKILNGYPQKAWNGGMVREIRPSVLMLERGYVFNIDGCKCFAFGGARSHDISGGILKAEDFESKKLANKEAERWNLEGKTFRVNHVSWWEQEMPEQMEMERGWAMLEDEKYKVDFIFSHDCPASDKFFVLRENCPDELNKYLEQVKQKVDYKKWFFGHYHENMMIPGSKDLLLYEQLVQIN